MHFICEFQEQKKRKICYAEFNQVATDNDDDGIDVDMPLDINCNHENDAHRQKKCDIKKELHEIKDSVNRAIDLLCEGDSEAGNADV